MMNNGVKAAIDGVKVKLSRAVSFIDKFISTSLICSLGSDSLVKL